MTKQEEIDWGLRSKLEELFGCDEDSYLYTTSKEIREWFASQGAVIKVDRELPSSYLPPTLFSRKRDEQGAFVAGCGYMLKAGYVAVEPLIGAE